MWVRALLFSWGIGASGATAGAEEPPVPPALKPPVAKDAKDGALAWLAAIGEPKADAKALRARVSLPFWTTKMDPTFATDSWRQAACQKVTAASTEKEWEKLAGCLLKADLNTSLPSYKDSSELEDGLQLIFFPDLPSFKKKNPLKVTLAVKKADRKRLEALASNHSFVHVYLGERPSYTYLLAVRYTKPGSPETVVSAMLLDVRDEGR